MGTQHMRDALLKSPECLQLGMSSLVKNLEEETFYSQAEDNYVVMTNVVSEVHLQRPALKIWKLGGEK